MFVYRVFVIHYFECSLWLCGQKSDFVTIRTLFVLNSKMMRQI